MLVTTPTVMVVGFAFVQVLTLTSGPSETRTTLTLVRVASVYTGRVITTVVDSQSTFVDFFAFSIQCQIESLLASTVEIALSVVALVFAVAQTQVTLVDVNAFVAVGHESSGTSTRV